MASALIHMAVAKKANEKLGFQDENSLFLGTIAPDLGKLLGETKEKGHFETNNTYLPNLNKYLSKYKIDKPFEMGYYIHLYTDLIWFTEFMPNYYKNEILYLNDGTFMDCSFDLKMKKVYNDYSIFNGLVIDKYNLNLDIFYKNINFESELDEVDLTKIDLLLKQVRGFIEESDRNKKPEVFSLEAILEFIDTTAERVVKEVLNGYFNIGK